MLTAISRPRVSPSPRGYGAFTASWRTSRLLLGATMLFAALAPTIGAPSPATALDVSLRPDISDTARMGPNGARIEPVKNLDFFGLDGRDNSNNRIPIGQSEPSEPLDTHNMLTGRTTRNGGSGATATNHATSVASIMIGAQMGSLRGIAHQAQVFSSGGNYYTRTDWLIDTQNVEVLNNSAGFGPAGNNGDSPQTLFADLRVFQDGVIWVKSAGNGGAGAGTVTKPGDGFNVITVGHTGADATGSTATEDYTRVFDGSSRGPTADSRHKPDIVAPGSLIHMAGDAGEGLNSPANNVAGTRTASGTSYAAPHVAGMAALLIERGRDAGLSHDHLSIKSILLNSASKHIRDPNNANRAWPDTPAATSLSTPLDDAMGAGQLNGLAALRQYQPGFRSDVGLQGTSIGPGATNTSDLFVGGQTLKPGSLITATLVWDRPVSLKTGGDRTQSADYENKTLPNLDLELVKVSGGVVAQSNSGGNAATGGNSVEHIYFNVPSEGSYQLRVRNRSAVTVPDFGLTWTSGTSNGMAFSVDGGHFNNARVFKNPAEGQMAPFGNNPFPNDVNALGTTGPGHFPTEAEIFVSSRDGTNMQRLSGALGTKSRVGPYNAPPAAMAVLDSGAVGVLGLKPNDNTVGLSWGTDGTFREPSVLVFSVDTLASGIAGTSVNFESLLSPPGPAAVKPFPDNPGGGSLLTSGNEAAGDVFKTPMLDPFGFFTSAIRLPATPGSNVQLIDEANLGLQAPTGNGSLQGFEDDLDALEMDNPLSSVDQNGDGLQDAPVYFNLDRVSPSLSGGMSADDIFVSTAPFSFDIFADGVADMGLSGGDAIDALILSDTLFSGLLDPGVDEALFSLDLLSSTSPGDIFYTDFMRPFMPGLDWKLGGSLFASAASIGLLATDNLNALDMFTVPEPSGLALLALGGLVLAVRRRQVAGT